MSSSTLSVIPRNFSCNGSDAGEGIPKTNFKVM